MSIINFTDLEQSLEEEMKEKPVEKPKKEDKHKPDLSHKVEQKGPKKGLFDYLNEVPSKASTLNKKFRLWARKRKNLSFYKRYLDRVQSGLYKRYAGEAKVEENAMVDDPVQILKGPAQNYIRSLVKNINSLYETVTKMAADLENKPNIETAIPVIEAYCKDAIGQNIKGSKVDSEKQTWKEKLIHSTKYKIAKILLSNRDTEVYGYTAKNMVLKGYPKPNHLIVTLFVENPDQLPAEQSVSDIFRTVESFEILADSDKQDVFNIANMTKACMEKTVDNKIMNEIKERRNKCISAFKNANIEDKKEQGKILDSIWDGLNGSCKELLSRKAYLIDCINIYFDMILRIDNLGKKAIQQMLDVEMAYNDPRYNKSLNVDLTKTKDKNNRYMDHADGHSPEERRERYKRMNETAKKLNKM